MSNTKIVLTSHFIDRYRQRIAKTSRKRIQKFATDAYVNGTDINDVNDSLLRNTILSHPSDLEGNIAIKIYKGFVYIFNCENVIISVTTYRIPNSINNTPIHI